MKDLYDKYSKYFFCVDWYKNEDFFTEEKTKEGMAVIGKNIIPETLDKNYEEQDKILKELGSERRSAVEIMYDIIQYKEKTGYYLLGSRYEWSSSRSSDGRIVGVGSFDSDGVNVNSHGPDYSNDGLGVSFSQSLKI